MMKINQIILHIEIRGTIKFVIHSILFDVFQLTLLFCSVCYLIRIFNMSDTSIIASKSSQHSHAYDIENNSYRRKGNCWSRLGANICVGILAISTILLALALAYVLYQHQSMENLRRIKAQKAGKKFNPAGIFGGAVNFAKHVISGSSDNTDSSAADDESIDDS